VDATALALPFFPGVGDTGILVCILDADGRIFCLFAVHDIQAKGAQADLLRVGTIDQVFYRRGEHVLLCASGIAVDHGEITGLYAFGRDGQVVTRTVRHVVGAVVGGLVVLSGINAEQ